MKWVVRKYSKSRIDRAGETLVAAAQGPLVLETLTQYVDALDVVNNWRSCHAFPLNTMQVHLRRLARQVDEHPLVAQRIKRLSSIELKLQRFATMTLSQMQDLGGCRAIVSNTPAVLRLMEAYRQSRIKHHLHTLDNYIDKPQGSGYRGVHLIYRYYSDRSETYNGQKIEIQLRSSLQHSWATAVETVGLFTSHALKSSIGPGNWLRFFALMGSVIAIREGTNTVPGTPEDRAVLLAELREISAQLDVVARLRSFGTALTLAGDPELMGTAHYFLVQLDLEQRQTTVKPFKASDLERANEEYLAAERSADADGRTGQDAVLVSVDNLNVLQRAYPNYFLDTTVFTNVVEEALGSTSLRKARGSNASRT